MTSSALHNPDISIHFAQVITRRAAERGLDPEALCEAAGFSPALLHNPQMRMTPSQLGALMREVWHELDDELAGFGAAPQRFGCFPLMARQMVDSATLGQALRYSCRFYNLTSHALRWDMVDGPRAVLTLQLLDYGVDPDHFLEEFILLIWHRFSNWLVGERIPLLQTRFRFSQPAHAEEHRLMFPGPVHYEQEVTALYFDGGWLEAPIARSREELSLYVQRLPDEWFIKQTFEGSVTERVMSAIEESGHSLTLERLADRWHMSRRTLHRQLQREGTSFRRLSEQLRRDRAVALLLEGRCQVREIAHRLDMTEPAFSRAFKQWTGMTPLAYRKLRIPLGGGSKRPQ
jgi:AraC-like DNA-binding protein